MHHLSGIVLSSTGARKASTDARPVFLALPTSALRMEGKPLQLIQEALAARGSSQLPRTVWPHSGAGSSNDIRSMGNPKSAHQWRYFPQRGGGAGDCFGSSKGVRITKAEYGKGSVGSKEALDDPGGGSRAGSGWVVIQKVYLSLSVCLSYCTSRFR